MQHAPCIRLDGNGSSSCTCDSVYERPLLFQRRSKLASQRGTIHGRHWNHCVEENLALINGTAKDRGLALGRKIFCPGDRVSWKCWKPRQHHVLHILPCSAGNCLRCGMEEIRNRNQGVEGDEWYGWDAFAETIRNRNQIPPCGNEKCWNIAQFESDHFAICLSFWNMLR